LSRVRLALEVVLAGHEDPATLVFDEIDAGIGGAVGVEVGRRLARLAQTDQVVLVTHLAQVAAFADRHYVVVKTADEIVTTTAVRRLDDAERPAELARMMGGLVDSASAQAHARELLALAAEAKAALGPAAP
jgi:DNA repair protein RecN (Recombination protein N)